MRTRAPCEEVKVPTLKILDPGYTSLQKRHCQACCCTAMTSWPYLRLWGGNSGRSSKFTNGTKHFGHSSSNSCCVRCPDLCRRIKSSKVFSTSRIRCGHLRRGLLCCPPPSFGLSKSEALRFCGWASIPTSMRHTRFCQLHQNRGDHRENDSLRCRRAGLTVIPPPRNEYRCKRAMPQASSFWIPQTFDLHPKRMCSFSEYHINASEVPSVSQSPHVTAITTQDHRSYPSSPPHRQHLRPQEDLVLPNTANPDHRRRADESRVRPVHVTTSLNDHNALPKRVVRKESKQDVTVTVASSPRRRRVVAASLCWPGNPALAGGQPGRIIIGHGDLSKLQTSFVVVVVVRRRRCSSSSSVAVVVVVVATVELYVQPLSSCLSLYLFIGDALPQSRVDGTLASAC